MINYEYEELFESNSIEKHIRIQVYDGTSLESVITNADLYMEDMELTQSLCSENQLRYGTCESNKLKFTVQATVGSLLNKKLKVFVTPEGGTALKLGEFTVVSDKISSDRRKREVEAYDSLYEINRAEVSEWYSECGLPLTLKDFRDSFFSYFGVEQEEISLPNDSMVITETVLPETLSGSEVVTSICEANGCFGTITNDGKFRYVFLGNTVSKSYYTSDYRYDTLKYEDYSVKRATSLKLYSNDDVVIEIGSGDNQYVIEDNFLFYDKIESVLSVFVQNIYDIISETLEYIPLEIESTGNPCIEVGDYISVEKTDEELLNTYVLSRKITGIQSLKDNIESDGEEYFVYDLNSSNAQIRRLWNNTLALQSEIYGARTYVYAHRANRSFHIGADSETEIVSITLATVDEAIPVFLATIPLTMSIDGEVIFRYYIDGVQLMEDEDTIYLTKGKQFVTLSTFMELEKNVTRRFTVTAQTAYRESENRKQDAKIISLKDWIDNQTITVSGNTATFDYDYVEHPVDTTPPGAVIAKNEMRAMVFGSGLSPEEPWSGLLTIAEPQEVWNLVESGFAGAGETLTLPTQTPINITCADNSATWGLIEIGFASAGEITNRVIELHTNSKRRITEDGGVRIIESGETRYTEGE